MSALSRVRLAFVTLTAGILAVGCSSSTPGKGGTGGNSSTGGMSMPGTGGNNSGGATGGNAAASSGGATAAGSGGATVTATGGTATGGASAGGSAGMAVSAASGGASGTAGGAGAGGSAGGSAGGATAGGTLIGEDTFTGGMDKWSVELESGGTVQIANGIMDVDVPAGATVWFKQQLSDPIVIQFTATAVSAGGVNDHVTDLNMFWNARDVRSPNDLFATKRTGVFADYDYLKTYYVGYGANLNTTTRMRRYVGESGNRPLLFDFTTPLLIANHTYQVKLVADGAKVQYFSDGKVLFDYSDDAPYTSGWFAFRTTGSHFHFGAFTIRRP